MPPAPVRPEVGFIGTTLHTGSPAGPCAGGMNTRCHRARRGRPATVGLWRRRAPAMAASSADDGESVDAMRARLEGLFGASEAADEHRSGNFDGKELRRVLRERFTVEYDVQPVVRNDRVYVHVLWRYFEQVSFYMEEPEWAEHTEAVADLLKKWGAVDYFCDYIATIKKRPVVGISLNVPIPGVVRGSPLFPSSDAFDD
jgi:hypothetical protein